MHKYQFLKADIEPWLKYSFVKKYGIPTKYVDATLNTNTENILTTVRGKIKNFKLRGNTYQKNTTGKNIVNALDTSSLTNFTKSGEIFTTSALTSSGYIGATTTFTNSYSISSNSTIYVSADLRLVSGSVQIINALSDKTLTRPNGSWVNRPTISSQFQRYCYKFDVTAGDSFTGLFLQIYNSSSAVLEVKNIMFSYSDNYDYEPYSRIIPPEYTTVDYIESSGTQYIDTTYIPKNTTKWEMTAQFTENVPQYNGRYDGTTNPVGQRLDIAIDIPSGADEPVFFLNGGLSNPTNYVADINKHTFVVDMINQIGKIDNNSYPLVTQDFNSQRRVYLFARQANTIEYKCKMKLYNCKFYENNVLKMNFIPCYRNSDNEVGLYDSVNGVFYTNQGTDSFTYGAIASIPNPDYPQDIQVVSGDAKVIVQNKNLCKSKTVSPGTNKYSSVLWIKANLKPSTTYTISFDGTNGNSLYTNENLFNHTSLNITSSRATITVTTKEVISESDTSQYAANNGWIIFKNNAAQSSANVFNNLMIEENSIATSYVEHQEQVYPINLGVENLLNLQDIAKSDAGLNLTVQNGVVNITGTYSSKVSFAIPSNAVLKAGTYTLGTNSNTDNYPIITLRNDSTVIAQTIYDDNGKKTFTLENDATVDNILLYFGGDRNYQVCMPMLEKGTKQNSFSPYGITPIELCKIGDYQDDIRKTTGKNLFDKDNASVGRLAQNGNIATISEYFTSEFIKVEPNTQYTKNSPTADAYHRFVFYSTNDVSGFISISNNNSVTTPSNCQYLRFCGEKSEIDTAQLEEGSQATYWEPYGKKWIKYGAIGKLVLDGSENYELLGGSTIIDNTYLIRLKTKLGLENYSSNYKTTHFIANNASTTTNIIGSYVFDKTIRFRVPSSIATTSEEFKDWIANNNVTIYYKLATPEITEITDSNLISQLDDIEYAMSYKDQTNITIETNINTTFDLSYKTIDS